MKILLLGLLLIGCVTTKSYKKNPVYMCIKDYVDLGIMPRDAFEICSGIYVKKLKN